MKTSVVEVMKVKRKLFLVKLFVISLQSCRQRMMLFPILVHSKSCLHFGLHISDDYFAVAPPDKPEVQPVSEPESLYSSCFLS